MNSFSGGGLGRSGIFFAHFGGVVVKARVAIEVCSPCSGIMVLFRSEKIHRCIVHFADVLSSVESGMSWSRSGDKPRHLLSIRQTVLVTYFFQQNGKKNIYFLRKVLKVSVCEVREKLDLL